MLLQRVDQTTGRGGLLQVMLCVHLGAEVIWLVVLAFKLAGLSCGISLLIGSVFVSNLCVFQAARPPMLR